MNRPEWLMAWLRDQGNKQASSEAGTPGKGSARYYHECALTIEAQQQRIAELEKVAAAAREQAEAADRFRLPITIQPSDYEAYKQKRERLEWVIRDYDALRGGANKKGETRDE